MRDIAEVAAFLAGLTMTVVGIYAIWPPLALIVGGLALVALAVLSGVHR